MLLQYFNKIKWFSNIIFFCQIQILYIWWILYYYYSTVYSFKLIKTLVFILLIVLSSTYLSLMERHIVAVVQQRVGPTSTGLGLLQPLADAFKLLTKEPTRPYKSYIFLFRTAPIYTFAIAVTIWACLPLSREFIFININYNLIYILVLLALNNYGIIFGAWASQNKYALFSGYRTIALTSSYGISISLIFWYPSALAHTYNLGNIVLMQQSLCWFILPGLPLGILFWIILLTEVKKIPFDVTESEAELGSGYLVEYSGMGFALYIISEYCYILILNLLFIHCFLGGWSIPFTTALNSWPLLIILVKLGISLFIYFLVRSALPNYRFDFIMSLHWRCLFPLTLILAVFSVFLCSL